MKRRSLLIGGASATAALAGVGVALWQQGRIDASPANALWPLKFERPEGGELQMATLRGKPLLVNFWATWCPPCVREIPLLDRFHRDHQARGWQVVGLAADNIAPVREFLTRQPVAFAIGLAGLGGVDLARRLGNTTGGLPFTLVFTSAGEVAHRKLGVLGSSELDDWGHSVT